MFEKNKIISHRGIHDNKKIYENTLEAFKSAIDKNYIIELDIHLTKDKKIVVFHDENLKRLTGLNRIVEKSTYDEINKQNMMHIPLLEEVLELVNTQVPFLIEIKQPNRVGELETKLMNILKDYSGEYAIQSFNPKVLLWFKKHHSNVLRGQLSCQYTNKKLPIYKKFILKNMLLNVLTKPHFISYKYNELSPKKITKYRNKNIILLGWTITTQKDYDNYIQYYDNLICEKFI